MSRLEWALREAAAAAREHAEQAHGPGDRIRLDGLATYLWAEANATKSMSGGVPCCST